MNSDEAMMGLMVRIHDGDDHMRIDFERLRVTEDSSTILLPFYDGKIA